MLFANVAPNATRKPRTAKVVGSPAPKIRAEFEAMKRFEGLAKGMRLSPKELSKTTSSSMNDAILSSSILMPENGVKADLQGVRAGSMIKLLSQW